MLYDGITLTGKTMLPSDPYPGQIVYLSQISGDFTKGIYFWDGETWNQGFGDIGSGLPAFSVPYPNWYREDSPTIDGFHPALLINEPLVLNGEEKHVSTTWEIQQAGGDWSNLDYTATTTDALLWHDVSQSLVPDTQYEWRARILGSNGYEGLTRTVSFQTPVSSYEIWGIGQNSNGHLLRPYNNVDSQEELRRGVVLGVPKDVSKGYTHTAVVMEDGTLWTVGQNSYGQLGHGDRKYRDTLTQVGTDTDWDRVFAGAYNIFALKADGRLYAAGRNIYGMLGLNTTAPEVTVFTHVSWGGMEWSMVAPGLYHTLAIRSNGELWGWGRAYNGQLATSLEDTDKPYPIRISSSTGWKDISTGNYHSAAINGNSLYLFGDNGNYQIGDSTQNDKAALTVKSGAYKAVACGSYYTLALNTSGQLYGAGQNTYGQCGLNPDSYEKVAAWRQITSSFDGRPGVKVSAHLYHSAVINDQGEVYTFGRNNQGQLGRNEYQDSYQTWMEIPNGPWKDVVAGQGYSYSTMLIK